MIDEMSMDESNRYFYLSFLLTGQISIEKLYSMDDYERIHLIKQEVFVYKIPPLQSNRGARAAEWNLDNPDWTGRLKLVSKAGALSLKLEDKSGALFAKAPIEAHPGVAVQPVSDSSRYFVVRLLNDNGQTAFIGIGFADRGDSFDLNVSLQDFFKEQTRDTTVETTETTTITPAPKLDLAFKEGQTIHINFGNRSAQRERPSRPSAAPGSGPVPFLPPPPSGSVTRTTPVVQQQTTQVQSGGGDSSNPFATTEQIDASTTQPNPFLSNPVTASSPQGGSLLEF